MYTIRFDRKRRVKLFFLFLLGDGDFPFTFIYKKTSPWHHTGKLMSVPGPQYFKAARSYALAAASSSSYAPIGITFVKVNRGGYHIQFEL